MKIFNKQFRENKELRVIVYIACGIGIIWMVTMLQNQFFFEKKEFVPYSAKVVSYHTDKIPHGEVYYQRIKLDNNSRIIANGFSAVIDKEKTWLINYVAIGDSIVCDSTDNIIYIHRAGAETFRLVYSPVRFQIMAEL
ncbi:MAG: hypothetical protein IKR17_09375 [Bacteroidales bacterium]|nr:hypothetical protein [Bacteroidales bacterium]